LKGEEKVVDQPKKKNQKEKLDSKEKIFTGETSRRTQRQRQRKTSQKQAKWVLYGVGKTTLQGAGGIQNQEIARKFLRL